MAYSAAALIAGYARFRPDVTVAGVIFNFVNSEGHYKLLREACVDVGVAPLGFVPRANEIQLPSRHLGLKITPDHDYESVIARAAAHVAKTVDVDRLLAATRRPAPVAPPTRMRDPAEAPLRIAVARDDAFNFTYFENLQALERRGPVTFFSPVRDHRLPEADLLYLAGGYPELFLDALTGNQEMLAAIREHAQAGRRILAECGGLMYLGRDIVDAQGRSHPMAGLLPVSTSMQQAGFSLGYRTVELDGRTWRGHEFHFSRLIELEPLASVACVRDAKEREVETKIYRWKGVLASYVHFYWGGHASLPGD
jgi:cobyrinic acid a,c-diamide synthase